MDLNHRLTLYQEGDEGSAGGTSGWPLRCTVPQVSLPFRGYAADHRMTLKNGGFQRGLFGVCSDSCTPPAAIPRRCTARQYRSS